MQLCNLLMSCVAGSVPQGAPWLQQLSPQGGCMGPLDACHGGTGGDFQGWHCQLPSAVSAQPWDVDPVLVSIPLLAGAIPTADAAPAKLHSLAGMWLGHSTALPQLCFQIPWSGDTGEEQGPAPGPCIFCQGTESPSPGNKPSHSREINAGMACSQVG